MRHMRAHITKLFMIPMVILGLSLYVVRPAYARADQSFSFWLNSVVDKSQLTELQKEVDTLELRVPGNSIYRAMQEVFELIGQSGSNEFLKGPFKGASLDLYQSLLQQWNHFQSGKGMAAMPPAEVLKPLASTQVDKFHSGSDLPQKSYIVRQGPPIRRGLPENKGFYAILSPMVTGIAIGAP